MNPGSTTSLLCYVEQVSQFPLCLNFLICKMGPVIPHLGGDEKIVKCTEHHYNGEGRKDASYQTTWT